jgi:hypothetical protein
MVPKEIRVNSQSSCLYVPVNIPVAVLCDAATSDMIYVPPMTAAQLVAQRP